MKKIACVLFALLMLSACGKPKEDVKTYESVYEEYSQKIKDARDDMWSELPKEFAGKDDDGIEEAIKERSVELYCVMADGWSEMLLIKEQNGDTDEQYEEWSDKLYEVYSEEAQKVRGLGEAAKKN